MQVPLALRGRREPPVQLAQRGPLALPALPEMQVPLALQAPLERPVPLVRLERPEQLEKPVPLEKPALRLPSISERLPLVIRVPTLR